MVDTIAFTQVTHKPTFLKGEGSAGNTQVQLHCVLFEEVFRFII